MRVTVAILSMADYHFWKFWNPHWILLNKMHVYVVSLTTQTHYISKICLLLSQIALPLGWIHTKAYRSVCSPHMVFDSGPDLHQIEDSSQTFQLLTVQYLFAGL